VAERHGGFGVLENEQNQFRSLQDFYRFQEIDVAKREVVFYAETCCDWPYFEPLIRELVESEKQEICYVSSDPQDHIFGTERAAIHTFLIEKGKHLEAFFKTLDAKVMVMTLPELEQFFVRRSSSPVHYVYAFHTLISTHMGYMRGAFDQYDSILCAGPHHVAEIRAQEKMFGLPSKKLIECGYFFLDNIIRNWSEKKWSNGAQERPVSVVVAPTYGPQSLIELDNGKLCIDLIDTLLDAGMKVTLRLHWMTWRTNYKVIATILEHFSYNPAFTLERDTITLNSLAESDVLVCDLSGVALEYAFGFLKPVVYVDLPPRIRNSEFEKLTMPVLELDLRQETGIIVSTESLREVPKVIIDLVNDQSGFQAHCKKAREKWVFNCGRSAKVGAAYIKGLTTTETRPERQGYVKLRFPETRSQSLELKQASVTYKNGFVGLCPTDLKFNIGEFTVLLGPSGAGKSTLLRALNGLVPLSSGCVISNDLGDLKVKKIRRLHQHQTAMIFQLHQLIGRQTALQNVLTGRLPYHSSWRALLPWSTKNKRIALESLDRVGLLDKAMERVSNLSGGEKQRVGIARSLSQEPKIILADEPVASLDPAISENVLALLKDICEDKRISAIISLHQIEFAKKFGDRIIGINRGLIVFDGFPEDLSLEQLRVFYGKSYEGT